MASTEFPEESRRSSHSSIDLYSTPAKAILQIVSDRKCAVDSRPRIDRFCLCTRPGDHTGTGREPRNSGAQREGEGQTSHMRTPQRSIREERRLVG